MVALDQRLALRGEGLRQKAQIECSAIERLALVGAILVMSGDVRNSSCGIHRYDSRQAIKFAPCISLASCGIYFRYTTFGVSIEKKKPNAPACAFSATPSPNRNQLQWTAAVKLRISPVFHAFLALSLSSSTGKCLIDRQAA